MKLPSSFKFKHRDDNETLYFASVVGNEVMVDWNENKYSPQEWDKREVENLIEKGTWLIINDNPIGNYESIGTKIGQLVDKKNMQYGDSFNKSGQILGILYPNGVQPNQYRDMQAVTRIIDKLMRIANGNQGDENAYNDVAGYGILMSGGEANE